MGYTLEAVIGRADTLRSAVRGQPTAVLVPLALDVMMVPMTDRLFDSVGDGSQDSPLGFGGVPGGFDRVLAAWSVAGPVGYVEADFFGGIGTQRAAMWNGGELVVGPLSVDVNERFPAAGSPISQILRRLGVVRGSHRDEFDAVGLGRHRDTSDWLPMAGN
ncbi:hypothetical protein [Plantactinospora sp. GCM10030261]|uniref:hypothetical protein n=1 Tax=Plantactinospora sp. GCM10030261 TaxID=3273420 RepID=UPI00361DB0BC